MKKLLLLTMLGFGYSEDICSQSKLTKDAFTSVPDTITQKGPINPGPIAESEQSINNELYTYNNLFVSEGPGINANGGPRLNPRAVSFVQDYIEKNGKDLTRMKEWGLFE